MGKLTRRKRRNGNGNATSNKNSNSKKNGSGDSVSSDTRRSSWFERNAASLSRGLLQFGISWMIIAIIVNYITKYNSTIGKEKEIPMIQFEESKKAYVIQISEDERKTYHPVVIFPKILKITTNDTKRRLKYVPRYNVIDFSTGTENGTILKQVGIDVEDTGLIEYKSSSPFEPILKLIPTIFNTFRNIMRVVFRRSRVYSVGRHNEIRSGMYNTSLFQNITHSIDGFSGERIVHIGVDLYAPAKTKVFAFQDGIIHSFGYNSDIGDYGNVIVMEHNVTLKNGSDLTLWALYGHLSNKSIHGKFHKMHIPKGNVIGFIGNIHENGGWSNPHVHFQLSRKPPRTHDMPGVVSLLDREKALFEYPDPLLVLGPLY